jgi:D-alanyl-D-alanine carboxypeptidase
VPAIDDVEDNLTRFIAALMPAQEIPGLAIALTDRTHTLHLSTHGCADLSTGARVEPDTLFEIGSIGKSFTAIALLQEHEAGRLDLHAPVTDYLPWFQVQSSHSPITIHHLLSHTAGIITGVDFSPASLAEVWALRDSAAAWAPGERYLYSNDGYKTLGLVLNALTGRSYAEVIRERILDPLAMTHTAPTIANDIRRQLAVGYAPFYDDRPAPRGEPPVPTSWFETDTADGCLASTASDMAAYARMLLNGGAGPNGRILSPASFALLTQRAATVNERRWYGYGLATTEIDGRLLLGHGGQMPGFISSLFLDPAAGIGAVVLINGPGTTHIAALYALDLLRARQEGTELPPPPPLPDPLTVENAADYAGTYRADTRSFTLLAREPNLVMRYEGSEFPLEHRAPDVFYFPHPDFALALLRFGRDEEQSVVEAFHGADWYVNERYQGPRTFAIPDEWAAYAGHYRAFSPWISNLRVLIRKGSLIVELPQVDMEEPLLPIGPARFTSGDTPDYLQFGPTVDGRAISVTVMGGLYSRVNTP